MNRAEKLVKILFVIFIMVLSFTVLAQKIPESEFVQNTIERLEGSQDTVMTFSGTTIATSLALSALPNDFATPLAGTISDLNTYFIFIFATIFVEKLVVVEGIEIALMYVIPAACLLYIIFILTAKEVFKKFATKLLILGISLIIVIPFSTYFTENVCEDYLDYVDETIAEADAGAAKINGVMTSGSEDSTFFDKLSDAFKTSIQSMSDLLAYFKNVVKKCVNSVAIIVVINFVVPLLILMLFRWLLKELFSLQISVPEIQKHLPHKRHKNPEENEKRISTEDETCRR